MSSILIENLSKKYNEVTAVSDVNLEINNGEFVTILGPSGSGKTTLLTLIAGFEAPTSGTILIDNQNVVGLPPNKRNIGLLFQSYALFPHMNVYKNVAFPLMVRRYPKHKIQRMVSEALQKVQLQGYENRGIHEISGGQQQRVALARAFVFNPNILLLDEPMSALDKKLRQQVQIEIRQLQRNLGITTISVTHDQEEALTMSDRILIINNGVVEQFGSPEDLYQRPKNTFVASFLGSANLLKGKAKMLESGRLLVELEEGVSVKCINSHVPDNPNGHVMVRPSHVTLRSAQVAGGDGDMRACVISSIYLGASFRYQLKTEKGNEIIVTSQYKFQEGENVSICFTPDSCWFISDVNE